MLQGEHHAKVFFIETRIAPYLHQRMRGHYRIQVWRELATSRDRLSWVVGMGGFVLWLDVLGRAHATRDPTTGRPICLGMVSWGNLLVSRTGAQYLIGFGHNLAGGIEPGRTPGIAALYHSPEVAAGGAATPSTDVWGVMLLARTLLPVTDLPPALARVVHGTPAPGDRELAAALARLNARIFSPDPAERPESAAALLEGYRVLWSLLDVSPDPEAFTAFLAARVLRVQPEARALSIVVAHDASWIALGDGRRVSLARRRVPRELLRALLAARGSGLESGVPVQDLVARLWPGERLLVEAAAARVYTAVRWLRRAGLAASIVTRGDGYALAAHVRCDSER